MPLDGSTYTPTKADPFSLDTFIAWLERQDPARRFFFTVPQACLLTRYFADQGIEKTEGARNSLTYGGINLDCPEHIHLVWIATDSSTYGEALSLAYAERARREVGV